MIWKTPRKPFYQAWSSVWGNKSDLHLKLGVQILGADQFCKNFSKSHRLPFIQKDLSNQD